MERIEVSKTAPAVPRWTRWLMPSIGDVLFLVILFNILVQGNTLLSDPDTPMHIRAGDYILETLSIPKKDIFSHTMLDQTWIAHEWLSEVLFSIIHRLMGLNGLVVLTALLISGTFVLLFRILLKQQVHFLLAVVIAILATNTAAVHWLVRPHIFSMPLTLIWFYLLESYQRTMRRFYLYPLPFLMVLWVNLHAGYFTGFILIGIYLLGNLCDLLFSQKSSEQDQTKRRVAILGLAGATCFIAAMINPVGYKILLFPFQMTQSPYILSLISEALSPSFHTFSFYQVYLLSTILILGVSIKRLSFIELGMLIFWIHMSLFAARFIPLFAILAAPIMAKQLQFLIVEGTDQALKQKAITKILRGFTALSDRISARSAFFNTHFLLAVTIIAVLFLTFTQDRLLVKRILDYQFDADHHPVDAANFLRRNKITGRMFNTYGFGGYLIYALYPDPNYRVFVDGRSLDLYGDEFIKNSFGAVTNLRSDWKEVLDRYQVTWIIDNAGSSLSTVLLELPNWVLIYADKAAHIYVKRIPENQRLIEAYPDAKPVRRDEQPIP
jgi:hypothetical protein